LSEVRKMRMAISKRVLENIRKMPIQEVYLIDEGLHLVLLLPSEYALICNTKRDIEIPVVVKAF